MAANGRGYMRPNSAGRTPPFLIIGLLVVIGILAFNYWSLSSKNSALTRDMDEVEMKYRSVQMRKLDIEKRNADLSVQLEEAKKYRLEAQEKDMKLREAEQKESELNAKIDSLAGEMEVLKNDLNTCDDEVGFCHENITKLIISHKKALEEAHMKCNMKIDEATSSAEQRAASVEKHDLQQSQQLEPQPLQQQPLQVQQQQQPQPQDQQQPLQVQQQQQPQQQDQQQPLQVQQQQQTQQQDQQQPLQVQQQPVQEQQHPLQGLSQPLQGEQQPLQGQRQPTQELMQPLQQQQPAQEQKPLTAQQQPQPQPLQEQPRDQLQPQQNNVGEPQHLQQQLQNVTDSKKDERVEQNQEAKDGHDKAGQGKEPVVLEGLSQTNELARAVQEGYKRAPGVEQVEALQQEQHREASVSDQMVQGQKPGNLEQEAPVIQQNVDQATLAPSQREQLMMGRGNLDNNDGQQLAEAPAGHAVVQASSGIVHDDKRVEVPVDLNQRKDEADYINGEVGQPVGAEVVVAAQRSLSPLSIQVLSDHYQLPEDLRSELSRAENDLKSELAFSEEKPPLGSLKELLKSASQQSAINLRRPPAENYSTRIDATNSTPDTNHLVSNIDSSFDVSNLRDSSSLSTNLLDKSSLSSALDKSALLDQDQVEHDFDHQQFGSISMIEDSDSDHYEKAVSEILSKEALLNLPELEDLQRMQEETDGFSEAQAVLGKPAASPGSKKTFSHGFLYLNLSQLLEGSSLEEDFTEEDGTRQSEGDDSNDGDDDLFLDGTTSYFKTTTDGDYGDEATDDWSKTTQLSRDFDAVNIPVDQTDGRAADETGLGGHDLVAGQLPKAMDSQPRYGTLEDQLRLPMNDNGQNENEAVVPRFHEYAEHGQVNQMQQNDQAIGQVPQDKPFI